MKNVFLLLIGCYDMHDKGQVTYTVVRKYCSLY